MAAARIPIWAGGAYPKKGPVQRAARWDGAMLYKQPINDQWVDMMPEDVRALRATVERVRGASAPFEIVVGGRERRDDWGAERVHIHALAEAGATWWSEWVPAAPLHVMCEAIANGPLRVD